jgi:hypothetical protein
MHFLHCNIWTPLPTNIKPGKRKKLPGKVKTTK